MTEEFFYGQLMLNTPIVPNLRETFHFNKESIHKFCIEQSTVDGCFMEFGVATGFSIKFIAKVIEPVIIWGFDSFEGLPEDWDLGTRIDKVGSYKTSERPKAKNIKLVEGLFQSTLDPWMREHKELAKYIHIDCDLYSSAIFVLETLNSRIVPGTIIIFDEIGNFQLEGIHTNWRKNEWRALMEWTKKYNRKYKFVARSPDYIAAIKILA